MATSIYVSRVGSSRATAPPASACKVLLTAQICNGSVTAFGAKIISGFGYTSLQSTALLIPGGAVTCVTIYIFVYFADKYKNIRTYVSETASGTPFRR
jgi:hypothetical protein